MIGRRRGHALLVALTMGSAITGCGGGVPAPSDPEVRQATADVARAQASLAGFRGPRDGLRARPPRLVVFVAADLTNGGIAGVARGVQQAARTIGWPLRVLDGQASAAGRRSALRAAIALHPGGIILGGFDAGEQRTELRRARRQRIAVVGWHAGARPGPDPANYLFMNVTTDPVAVARLAARYVIADSGGTAQATIFTDSEFAIAQRKAHVMASELRACRRCRVLDEIDTPIASAETRMPGLVISLLQRYGKNFGYLLAINGAYIAGARPGLIGAGRSGSDPPFGVAAGDGDSAEFAQIRAGDYQKASIAEPLYLQGWQLIDELNRARSGRPASGYLAPPRLITKANVPVGDVFDPSGGYRAAYRRIWRR
jgi:ribose transport system substrate-binding protein